MILVTGGAGFIGSNLVATLSDQGRPAAICDRFGAGEKWRNIAKHEVADIVAPESLLDWLAAHENQVEAVVHLGAISATTETDVDRLMATNYRPSVALWRWCAAAGRPFVYASSGATYGDGSAGFDDDPSLEGLARLRPLNPYGWSKHLFDRWVARQVANGAPAPPQWAGLKFFNVYGPNEYHKTGMLSFVLRAHTDLGTGDTVRLFRSYNPDVADGEQRRDFVYVGDCIAVISWLLRHSKVSGLFNVGTGEARSFLDVTRAVFAALGREPRVAFVEMPGMLMGKYQDFTQARMERLRAAGYHAPFTRIEEGVADYVGRFLQAADRYR